MVREVREGYPLSLRVYLEYFSTPGSDLLAQTEVAFDNLLHLVSRPDAMADVIVVAMYFAIIAGRDAKLFQ